MTAESNSGRSSRGVSSGVLAACPSTTGRVLDIEEAVGRQLAVGAMARDDDVSKPSVCGGVGDGLDERVDVCVAGRRDAFAVQGDRATLVGDAPLPQQQHAVGDVGRRVSDGQRVERHAGNRAGGNLQLHGQLDTGARDVPR